MTFFFSFCPVGCSDFVEIPEGAAARPVYHDDVMSCFVGELAGQFQACLKLEQSVTSCLCLSL